MKKLIVVLFFLAAVSVNAQWDFSLGMGVNQVNSSSFREYINVINNGDLKDFSTTANFTGNLNYSFSENYQLGVELDYTLFSYNTQSMIGNYEISYGIIRPALLLNYVMQGEGYKLKFGGGLGLTFADVNEKSFPTEDDFSTTGVGILTKAEGHTKLSDDFYAVIGVNARLDFTGDLENDNRTLHNSVDKENVSLSSFSVGIKLGVSYYF